MQIAKSKDDFYTSVEKSLDEIDSQWRRYEGILIIGSHAPSKLETKIELIQKAREQRIPFLGICLGMQIAIIEYARNVLGWYNANSTEIDEDIVHPVVTKLPNLRVGIFKVDWPLWGSQMESHWHNYAFNKEYHGFYRDGFNLSYTDDILEILQLKDHPFFVGVQFHPEYQSSKDKPHPILVEFLKLCKKFAAVGVQR